MPKKWSLSFLINFSRFSTPLENEWKSPPLSFSTHYHDTIGMIIVVVVVVNLILFNIRKRPIRAVVVVCPLSPIGRLDHLQPLAHVFKSYGDHHIIMIMMLVMIDKNSYASNWFCHNFCEFQDCWILSPRVIRIANSSITILLHPWFHTYQDLIYWQ